MQVSPGISVFGIALFVIVLLGIAGAAFFFVILLRGGREDGAPPSRGAKIGCGVFAVFAVLVLGGVIRGCANRDDAPAAHTIEVRSSGSIFCGKTYRGEDTVLLGPAPDGAVTFPPETTRDAIFSHFAEDLRAHIFKNGPTMSLTGGGTEHLLELFEFTGVAPDGERDALVLFVLRQVPIGGAATESVQVWPIRVRDGVKRELSIGWCASSRGMRSSTFARLLGHATYDYTVEISTKPTDEGATYRVDRYVVPAAPAAGATSATGEGPR